MVTDLQSAVQSLRLKLDLIIEQTEDGSIDPKTAAALKGLMKLKLDTIDSEMGIRMKAATLALRYPHLFGLTEATESGSSALGQLLEDE